MHHNKTGLRNYIMVFEPVKRGRTKDVGTGDYDLVLPSFQVQLRLTLRDCIAMRVA